MTGVKIFDCYPPPLRRNRLAQEPPPGSAVELSRYFFYSSIGFFMVVVDAGQVFRCVGQHSCVLHANNIPEPKPKPKPKPAPKPKAAPKPGPKGQHRQEFRMVYHKKKGFTSEPVEH